MVAIQIAPGRAVAVAIVALLTFAMIPLMPGAVSQGTPSGTDVFVRPGEAKILQSNFAGGSRHTSFIDNGTGDVVLSVPVYNVGPAITGIPVYMWFGGMGATGSNDPREAYDRTDCVKAERAGSRTLAAGTPAEPTFGWANFTINTRGLPPGAWNITVAAFNASKPLNLEPEEDCLTNGQNPTTRPLGTGTDCLSPGVSCRVESDPNNNHLRAYFVKERLLELQIRDVRWCKGGAQGDRPDLACDETMLDGENVWNTTPLVADPWPTHFEVVVERVAGKPHSWVNASNFGGPCMCADDGFGYELNVSVTGPYLPRVNVSRAWHTGAFHLPEDSSFGLAQRALSMDFDLRSLAGVYNVTVKVDQFRQLRRHATDTADDTAWRNDIEVAYRDFTGNFTVEDFRTTAATAHEYDGPFTIGGKVTLENKGPAGRPSGVPVRVTVFLDNETWVDSKDIVHYNSKFRKNTTFTPTDNFSTLPWEFTIEATSNRASDEYLPPGRHTLYGMIDAAGNESHGQGNLLESNESNNLFSIPIYVRDTTTPTFNGTPKITLQTPQGFSGPSPTFYRPLEGFNIYAGVRDDDNDLDVVMNISLASDSSVYRHVPAVKAGTPLAPDRYVAQVANMTFHNFSAVPFNGTENWTVTVYANDSFGNDATSAPIPLRLKAWPIHNASTDRVVIVPDGFPADTLSWNGNIEPEFKIRVEPNMTGFDDDEPNHQQFKTSNLAYNITVQATGVTFHQNGTYWLAGTPPALNGTPGYPAPQCDPSPDSGKGTPDVGEQLPGGAPDTCDESINNTFRSQFFRTNPGAAPGLWNYSIRVSDIAGYTRVINGTLLLEDLKPTIHAVNLSGVNEVTPPGTLRVQANVSDDNNQIHGAFLNLTRIAPGDGLVVNVSLAAPTEEASGGSTWFKYNETIDVKRGLATAIGVGGTFNVSVHVVDDVGNWERSSVAGNLTIKDEEAPQLVAFGVDPAIVEINENVTFWANATDATNVTMKLEIFTAAGSQELLMDAILIEQGDGGGPIWNYTHELNFTTEAVHGWRITAIDSVNRASTPGTGTITVRDNLGPKYDVRSPSVVIDGERYGSGTPRIEVVVHDVEGVLASSLAMEVGGLPVDFEMLPAPGNLVGYLVTYTVPASKKFSHNDVVTVNLTAQDNSTEQLTSFHNFSFIVDDVAPTARLVSVSPSYRDQPAHVLNVSLGSRFTLAAEDIDGLPTQIPVGGIRYRILGGGPGAAETVYSAPFRINDAAGVYTGPRLYQVQFWAEDDVGNFNRNFNVTTVYVDDTPPALFQFFPQGRNINATFVDDRVGVNRSVVWYRINDGAYVPLPLVERESAWTIELPEGVKGDRISYYLQAWDRLDNTETFGNATNPYASFDVSNHEPKVRIVSPVDGGRVSRSVDITWEASDEDGDALVFTLYYRAPGRTNFVELDKLENSAARRYTVDTTRFPDGQYTFRIAAGDGGFVKLAETTVTVINRADAIGQVTIDGEALPGSTMLVKAEVTKAEAIVEARLYLGETLVGSYPMNDEARDGDETANDGIYTARVPISAAGDYRVEIYTQYREDGELKESSVSPASAAFSAKLTPGYILSEYGAIIALIGLLAAVGIGVAVFVVMRRR